jgi:HEAT repeat protein
MKRLLTAPAMIMAALMIPANMTAQTEDRAKSLIAEALGARNPDTRKEAVKALGLVGSYEQVASRLEAMLKDNDVQVRIAAVDALAETKDERAIPILKTALSDKANEVRFAAAKALFKLNDPAGRDALIAILNREAKTSSSYIAQEMREARRMMSTPKVLVMLAVKQGVGFAPVPGLDFGFSTTLKLMSDSGAPELVATALLLGKDKNPEVIEALRNALADKTAAVRAAAVQAIAKSGNATLKDDVAELFSDKNGTVRVKAAACYLRLTEGGQTASNRADEE